MKWNWTRLTAGCRREQGGMGMKIMTALILALAMVLAMFCATAEDSYAGLVLDESVQASDEAITIEDEATDASEMDIELAEDTILDEDAIVVDEPSLDGLENNVLQDGMSELEVVADDSANALTGNEIDENGVLVKYVGPGGDVVIPDGVTSIGEGVFYHCSSLTSVIIPDGVTSIGACAFYVCDKLTSVAIPNSVTRIGDEAFAWCNNLTNVTIPDSVTSIGDEAFVYCWSLTNVTIPDSVTGIGAAAFEGCSGLTSVTIGAGVNIEDLSKSFLLENGNIGAFAVSDNNDVYASQNGILYTYDMSTLLRCPAAKASVTIPVSVTSIRELAFAGCENLNNVTIPDSVTSIGAGAFEYCDSLTSVIISEGITSIGDTAFYGCFSLTSVAIPKSVITIGRDAFDGCAEDSSEEFTIYGYKGSYAETYAKENGFNFSILPDPINIAKAKITVPSQVYTGKTLKPAVTVKYGKKTLKKGVDYTVSYKNNKAIGTATVIVTGKGNYTGTAKKTFKINPKAVSGLKLTAGKGRLTVSWKKAAGGVTGYQLQYGLKKNFSGAKKATVKKAATVKATLKNLKRGKTWYVRIRALKKVGKTTYWSAWSAAKKAKVK